MGACSRVSMVLNFANGPQVCRAVVLETQLTERFSFSQCTHVALAMQRRSPFHSNLDHTRAAQSCRETLIVVLNGAPQWRGTGAALSALPLRRGSELTRHARVSRPCREPAGERHAHRRSAQGNLLAPSGGVRAQLRQLHWVS